MVTRAARGPVVRAAARRLASRAAAADGAEEEFLDDRFLRVPHERAAPYFSNDLGTIARSSHRTVRHAVAARACSISELITGLYPMSKNEALELLRLGAVYASRGRVFEDAMLSAGSLVRFFPIPVRFPEAERQDPRDWVLAVSDDYVVVCKPPRIPSVPKVDNYRESVLTRLRELYPGEGLAPMNRIDVNTRGIIILGRSERFKREFGHLLQSHRVQKEYAALTATPVAAQQYTCYTRLEQASKRDAAREFSELPGVGLKKCLTVVRECSPVALGFDREGRALAASASLSTQAVVAELFEVQLQLLTGRTHQIRGQLALLGAPVFGDWLYGWRPTPALASLFPPTLPRKRPGPEAQPADPRGCRDENPFPHPLVGTLYKQLGDWDGLFALQARRLTFEFKGQLHDFKLPNTWSF